MSEPSDPLSQWLSPELLADIEYLTLRPRANLRAGKAGMHRSQKQGGSVEFSEHKIYAPGDDPKRIDWHAWAKTDRLHIKRYEDESALKLHILLDRSASMGFATPDAPQSKAELGERLAFALAYLAVRQSDSVTLTTFSGTPARAVPVDVRSQARGLRLMAKAMLDFAK